MPGQTASRTRNDALRFLAVWTLVYLIIFGLGELWIGQSGVTPDESGAGCTELSNSDRASLSPQLEVVAIAAGLWSAAGFAFLARSAHAIFRSEVAKTSARFGAILLALLWGSINAAEIYFGSLGAFLLWILGLGVTVAVAIALWAWSMARGIPPDRGFPAGRSPLVIATCLLVPPVVMVGGVLLLLTVPLEGIQEIPVC